MTPHWTEKLTRKAACEEAVLWARHYSSFTHAWLACERGDWMLWWVGQTATTLSQRRKLVLAACQCARLSLKYVAKGEQRPRQALALAETWARGGDVTLEEVRSAASAACASATCASACASAASSAAYACAAASDAAYASASAYAADAAYAASASASDAAKTRALALSARIIRKAYPSPPRLKEKP